MLRATAVVVLLTTVRYAAAEEQLRDHFVVRSPNGRFEATFDQMAMPPFTIRETGTNKPMMSPMRSAFVAAALKFRGRRTAQNSSYLRTVDFTIACGSAA